MKPKKMTKLTKVAKAKKPRKLSSEEQVKLKTECGFCGETFPDPTLAAEHLDDFHEGEYA